MTGKIRVFKVIRVATNVKGVKRIEMASETELPFPVPFLVKPLQSMYKMANV